MNRGQGKTTALIKKSAQYGFPILVAHSPSRSLIKDQAKAMGLDIPEPIVAHDFDRHGYSGKVLVDDADRVLQSLLLEYTILT